MKKTNLIILVLALLLCLAGCGSASAPPEEQTICDAAERYILDVIDSAAVVDRCAVERTEQTGDELSAVCRAEFTLPSGKTGGEIALTYHGSGSGWELTGCRATLDDTAHDRESLSRVREFQGHSYCVYCLERIHSWEEASAFCESMGGHLATISSKEENQFLYHYLKVNGFCSAYFGYSDAGQEGDWKWVTGETADYTNWYPDTPNDDLEGEDYAAFYNLDAEGRWDDGDFGVLSNGGHAFLCEWDEAITE